MVSSNYQRNINDAAEAYFTNPPYEPAPAKVAKTVQKSVPKSIEEAKTIFSHYMNEDGEIGEEGIDKLFKDIGTDASDPVALVISFKMGAKRMGIIKLEEFINGMNVLGCASLKDIKALLPTLKTELRTPATFKTIYRYTYDFIKELGVRNVDLGLALHVLEMLFKERFGQGCLETKIGLVF